MVDVTLHLGDCLDVLPTLADRGADAIIADLPYGITACKWDSVIPLEPLWEQYKRVIKPKGAVVLFGSQPFTSRLVMSNLEWFKYCWVWDKGSGGAFVHAKHRPLQTHEDICVFSKNTTNYHPIMTDTPKKNIRPIRGPSSGGNTVPPASGLAILSDDYDPTKNYPKTVLRFSRYMAECNSVHRVHPTQKPVALLAYLVRTYTNPGETVLDNTMGSGSTSVACIQTGRNFIGIEIEPNYFDIAQKRIAEAQAKMNQPQQAAMRLTNG